MCPARVTAIVADRPALVYVTLSRRLGGVEMSLIPVPEVREMVAVAKRFAAGEAHFSQMVGPTERCGFWAKVHGTHPAILELATEWGDAADRVWNEHGQNVTALPVADFSRLVAEDLGERE